MLSNTDFDLNLLKILDALFEHRNVSKAAESLRLKQSTVSHALGRAREHFEDALFVRGVNGMTTTRLGEELEREVRKVVADARRLGAKRAAFDPATAKQRIVISATDYFQLVSLNKLVKRLCCVAPGIQLSVKSAPASFPKLELERGEFDLAIAGYYTDQPEGFFQSALFSDRLVTVARRGHPALAEGRIDLKTFQQQRHALLTIRGDFEEPPEFEAAGVSRSLVFGSSNYSAMAWVIAETDLLLTAPLKLVEEFVTYFPVEWVPCPIDLKSLRMKMYWHERSEADPLHVWIRQEIRSTLDQGT